MKSPDTARGKGGNATLSHEQLVGFIYDSIEDTEGWTSVLGELTRQFEADKAHLFVMGAGEQVIESAASGYKLELVEPWHQEYQRQDPRFVLSITNPGRAFSDVEVVDQSVWMKSAVYNEWLRHVDVRYSLFVTLPSGSDHSLAQAIMRPHGAAPFTRQDVVRLQRLLPHLKRATRLRQLLRATRDVASDLHRALDASPMPVAILDASGKMLCANARAKPMLEPSFGLALKAQRLTAVRTQEASAIARALAVTAQLAEPESRVRGASASAVVPPVVEITRPNGHRISLLFLPLRPRHGLRDQGDQDARVLVVLHDPRSVLRLNPALIAKVHVLTPTEAQLAAALAEGSTTEAFADARGISVGTVRTHLKRILEKTGTGRQADLVRVLLSSAAMHLGQ